MENAKRLGVTGIIIDDTAAAPLVNEVLHRFSGIIAGRMGLPYSERGVAVISLIVDGTNDEIGAMNGQLGKISGVSVRTALSKETSAGEKGVSK